MRPKVKLRFFFYFSALPSRRSGCRTGSRVLDRLSGLRVSTPAPRSSVIRSAEQPPDRSRGNRGPPARPHAGCGATAMIAAAWRSRTDKHSNHSRNCPECAPDSSAISSSTTISGPKYCSFSFLYRAHSASAVVPAARRHLVRLQPNSANHGLAVQCRAGNCSRKWLIR